MFIECSYEMRAQMFEVFKAKNVSASQVLFQLLQMAGYWWCCINI